MFTISKSLQWTGYRGANMEMRVTRDIFTTKSTTSRIDLDGIFECYGLEPTIYPDKDPRGIVAMPEGRYLLTSYFSPHFSMYVPIFRDISGHNYIEIHPGNFPADTHDCILPGTHRKEDYVENSRVAFNGLMAKLEEAWKIGPVHVTVTSMAKEA